jgi:DNA-binding SARP family transcriptional activator/tetratricopeptide (TPR) repeat protein
MDAKSGGGATIDRQLVVGLLGPVELVSPQGGLAGLAQPMLRVLVAMLGVMAGRVVPDEALVDALWGEEWSRERGQNLHTHVSALRRRMAAALPSAGSAVVRSGGGYRLALAEDEVDAGLFRSLTARGRQAAMAADITAAADLFSRALRLWRGPALADVLGLCPRLAGDAAGLEELRAGVLEERVECDLMLGRHRDVAAEGPALMAVVPPRERLAGQLMVALWRCGRRGEALATFDAMRRMLAAELGLDPGPELTRIHAQVLADDPALALPAVPVAAGPGGLPPGNPATEPGAGRVEAGPGGASPVAVVPRQLPAGVGFFAGRDGALKALDELLGRPEDPGEPGAVVVAALGGMAGVGKTALAVHWARKVSDRFPDGQLYVNLRGYDPESAPVDPNAVTGWFLAALGVPARAIPAEAQARAGLYRSVLADKRVLVVLDNARDAAQVRPLLAGGPACLAVVTSRSSLAGLAATEGARLVRLGVLDEDEAMRMLEARLGRERVASEPAAVADLIQLCAGLPLALAVLAARAAESPDLPLAALAVALASEPDRLDALNSSDEATSLRAVFSWSHRQLGEAAARMFALLGLHCGPDISGPAAASLAGLEAARARAALAELASANLVHEHQPGRYQLHELLRAYAAERAAEVCTEADIDAVAGRGLDHYLHTMAGLPSFWAAAFAVARPRPGVTPERLTDHARLLAWLRAEHQVLLQAVEWAVGSGFETEAWQIFFFLGLSSHWQGKWADWESAGRIALAAAEQAGDHRGQGWARGSMGYLHWMIGDYVAANAWYRRALADLQEAGDLAGQSVAHTGITGTLLDTIWYELELHDYQRGIPAPSAEQRQRAEEGLGHARQALALHRQLGRRNHEVSTLAFAGCHHAILGNFDLAVDTGQQALQLSREIGYLEGQSFAWDSLSFVHRLRGEFQAAIYCCEQSLGVLPEVGPQTVLQRAETLTVLGDIHEAVGDLQAARQAWQGALRIFEDLHLPAYASGLRARLNPG